MADGLLRTAHGRGEDRTDPARPHGTDHGSAPGRDPAPGPDEGPGPAVEAVLARYVERRRREAARSSDRFAADVVTHLADLVLRGGKRVRPAFLWWGWRASGGPAGGAGADAVLRAGAALELIQACAIVHDDLMDASPLRRGAPSAHAAFAHRHTAAGLRGDAGAFGASAAILTGDLALVWADDLWEDSGLDTGARERVRAPWRAMRTEMVAGQYLDLYGQATGARLKSGLYTAERPLHLGAAMAGAAPEVLTALRRAGRCAGVAFQLHDDLAGAFGSSARTGKPSGDDIRTGKPTYLTAVALRQARVQGRRAAERRLRARLGDPGLSAAGLEEVRTLLTDLGAYETVRRRIDHLVASAVQALDRAPLTAPAADRLTALIRGVTATPELSPESRRRREDRG